jgi:hypothetical protein
MAKTARKSTAASSPPAGEDGIRVRMYRQGLGDCFLVRLPRAEGRPFWLMIDCGVIVGTKDAEPKMRAVVADIIETTEKAPGSGGFVDVLVVTHEHWDHVSGFDQAKELFCPGDQKQQAGKLSIGEVWFAWTEDPGNELARQLAKERKDTIEGLKAVGLALGSAVAAAAPQQSEPMQRTADGIAAILGFFGLEGPDLFGAAAGGSKTGSAMALARSLSQKPVRYWQPGETPWSSADLPGLRIYPLGPPENASAIRRTDDRDETYHAFTAGPAADAFFGASPLRGRTDSADWDDVLQPFDGSVRGAPLKDLDAAAKVIETSVGGPVDPTDAFFAKHYFGERATELTFASPGFARTVTRTEPGTIRVDQSWRRIDTSWLDMAPEFALQLDGATNNTSLVLAIELGEGGPVFLFVGDAQAGNWLSWDALSWKIGRRTVTVPDLFARVVFYKGGHHGSHNATMKARGIERMTSGDLAAFIPVDRPTARMKHWDRMPLQGILDALAERTKGRVALSEVRNPDFPEQDFKAFGDRLVETDLYLELRFPPR